MVQWESFSKTKIGVIASLTFIFIVSVAFIMIITEYLCIKISSAVPRGDDDRDYGKV